MDCVAPPPGPPVTSVDDAIARMKAFDASLPPGDGVACFNRMYLEVTLGVGDQIGRGLFGDPGWISRLDVVFANLYFAAVDSMDCAPSAQPPAWRPLLAARSKPGIEPIQFALAGMNVITRAAHRAGQRHPPRRCVSQPD